MDTSTPQSPPEGYTVPRKTSKMSNIVKPLPPPTKNRFQPLEVDARTAIEEKVRETYPKSASLQVKNPFSDDLRKSVEKSAPASDTRSPAAKPTLRSSADRSTQPGDRPTGPMAGTSGQRASTSNAGGAKRDTPGKRSSAYCPPIVIQGTPSSHKDLMAELNSYIKKGFYVKYARYSFLIFIKDPKEFDYYKKTLQHLSEPISFHTYALPEEKTHAFVMRGMHGTADLSEIKEELVNEYQISVLKIFKMSTKYSPLYLVVTTKDTTLAYLQKNVKYLMNINVSWERRYTDSLITQCRNCQSWGHATSNCFRTPRCLKCAEAHKSGECPYPRDSPPKCANCGNGHLANNKDCPVYKFRIEKLNQQRGEPKLAPAPPPRTNPWRRQPQAASQTEARTQQNRQAPGTVQDMDKEFPPLRPAAGTSRTQDPPSAEQRSDLLELLEQSEKLSRKMNIQETVKAITKLNQLLEGADDPMKIIGVLQDFTKYHLPNYDIMPSCP